MLKKEQQEQFTWGGLSRVVGVLATFFVALEGTALFTRRAQFDPMSAALAGQVAILVVGLLFVLLDRGAWSGLGLVRPWKAYDAMIVPGIIILHYAGSTVAAMIMLGFGMDISGKSMAAGRLLSSFGQYDPGRFFLLALSMAVLAGIGEEMIFRGYLINRLEKMGLPAWACIGASAFIFGLAHWSGYGFWMSISKAVWFGIPTGIFFWYRRSLSQLVIAHAFMDFSAFVLVYIAAKLVPGMGI